MFRRILLATDLTAKSYGALQLAVSLANALSARLFALHVVPWPAEIKLTTASGFHQSYKANGRVLGQRLLSARNEIEQMIRSVSFNPDSIQGLVKVGSPPEVIAATADEFRADLIVVARGRAGRLGSTSEQVVRLIGRTVLVAPVKWARRMPVSAGMLLPMKSGCRIRRIAALQR